MRNIRIFGLGDAPQAGRVEQEFHHTVEAFEACGFDVPNDMTIASLLAGAGKPFMPEELPPPSYLPDISHTSKAYFEHTVHPELRRQVNRDEQTAWVLAKQIGRLMGAGLIEKKLMNPEFPLHYADTTLTVDGYTAPYNIESGHVVEFGLGLNGLASHISNLKSNKYFLTGVHRSRSEVTVLEGVAEMSDIGSDQLKLTTGGIKKGVDMLKTNQVQADIVVASRVHSAGMELRQGVIESPRILRDGGKLIARGPDKYPKGIGYEAIAKAIKGSRNLRILVNHSFTRRSPTGFLEPNTLIIAESNR